MNKKHAAHLASVAGHEDVIMHIHSQFIKSDQEDIARGAVLGALSGGHLNLVKKLIDRFKFSDASFYDEVLCSAVESGNLELMKYLVEKKGMISDFDNPILNAVWYGHLEIIKYFIEERGVKYSLYIPEAALHGQLHILKYFAQKNKDEFHATGIQVLSMAAQNRDLGVIKYLVEKEGIDLSVQGLNAIERAVRYGHLDTVKYLIEEKKVEVSVDKARSLVIDAARNAHLHIAKYLVEVQKVGIDAKAVNSMLLRNNEYFVKSYFVNLKVLDVENWGIGRFKAYQMVEANLLKSVNPLVHSFPLHDFNFKKEVNLKHAVLEMIFCTFEDVPYDIVRVLAAIMLGQEFKEQEFCNLPLPTPLNLEIEAFCDAYYERFDYKAALFLALLEGNQHKR